MNSAIEITNLTKCFPGRFSFNIPKLGILRGCITGLVGNNGAGKTTLFKLMTDLMLPDSGEVNINQQNVRRNEDWKFVTSCYFDESYVADYLSPLEYFNFLSNLKGIKLQRMETKLAELGILLPKNCFDRGKLIRDYSKGDIQKIGIASCFILDPEIVMLDEPFANLDPASRTKLNDVLAMQRHRGVTILLSSHDIQNICETCERVILLDNGKVALDVMMSDETKSRIKDHFR